MARQLRVEYARRSFGMMRIEMRDHLRASFIKNLSSRRLKLIPSRKERIGCVKNVSEQAFPLQCGTLDIPSADRLGFFFQSAHSAASMQG